MVSWRKSTTILELFEYMIINDWLLYEEKVRGNNDLGRRFN